MGKVNGSKMPLERKYQVFVNGYEIDVAKAVTPGLATKEMKEPVYGSDDPILANIVENGTLSLDLIEKPENNVLLDNLCNVSPDASEKGYNFNNFIAVAIWLNRKSVDNSQYIGAEFYGNATLAPSGKSGAPAEWGGRTYSGNCNTPRKFEGLNIGIAAEKVAVTSGSGTMTNIPHVNPDDGFYAVSVIALNYNTGTDKVTESEILTVDAGMVAVDKSVTIDASDLNDLVLSDVNYAYVIYLYSGSGIYPSGAIEMDGLYD